MKIKKVKITQHDKEIFKMDDVIVFGDKNNFVIQLGLHTNIEKCKLCFYVQGKKMGSFTKGGELNYSIKAYKIFTINKESYYDPIFEKMTPAQISKYLVDDLFALGRSSNFTQIEEYNKRKRLHLFFGSQFTNDGSEIILLYKEDEVKFIYSPPKKTTADEYIVDYEYFCKVFNKYIDYCISNKLV